MLRSGRYAQLPLSNDALGNCSYVMALAKRQPEEDVGVSRDATTILRTMPDHVAALRIQVRALACCC